MIFTMFGAPSCAAAPGPRGLDLRAHPDRPGVLGLFRSPGEPLVEGGIAELLHGLDLLPEVPLLDQRDIPAGERDPYAPDLAPGVAVIRWGRCPRDGIPGRLAGPEGWWLHPGGSDAAKEPDDPYAVLLPDVARHDERRARRAARDELIRGLVLRGDGDLPAAAAG